MKSITSKLLGRVADLVDIQPVLALFLGGALLAVFLSAAFSSRPALAPDPSPNLVWTVYRRGSRFLWALTLVGFLLATLSLLRTYLHQALARFQHDHGRVTEANFNAIQTIWGTAQVQPDLHFDLYYEEEVTERIESEDVTKPAVLRKKIVRHDITANPFISARHDVTLRQNARKKGSALYGGYDTSCRFSWKLKNPTDRPLNSVLAFALPAATGMYDELVATLNGKDVLPQMQLKDATLLLPRDLQPNEALDLAIRFKSRGMSSWYFQVQDQREIRDFTLTLNLPDLSKPHLNFPEGCMTPTDTKSSVDNRGSILTFRLDHAISAKGMGIALPTVSQPGETTRAVLGEVERGWLLVFASLVLGLTLAGAAHGLLLSVLFGAAAACAYGMLADFSDILFGFWGTAGLVLLPSFLLLAWLLLKCGSPDRAKLIAIQWLLFGIAYPCVSGLDSERQSLYFDVCALVFLANASWQLLRNTSSDGPALIDRAIAQPEQTTV
jgi:hypothetical protein